MALSDERIEAIFKGVDSEDKGRFAIVRLFARAIEDEVRKQDEALILQLVEALNECQCSTQERIDALTESGIDKYKPIYFRSYVQDLQRATDAITAGRARLEGKT